MTPEQKIKYAILALNATWQDEEISKSMTGEEVDEAYETLEEEDAHWDAKSEIREGQFETGLPCDYSRHYESHSVAAQTPDGSYVGWTYWYGGGKHGEPEAMDWMNHAYDLDCVEEEKLMIVRTFTKKEAV